MTNDGRVSDHTTKRCTNEDKQHFPIIWVHSTANGRGCFAGFCGKTNMLYHVVGARYGLPLGVMVIRDFHIGRDGRCEEERGCLNQTCPLNRTTPASYWKAHGLKGRPPMKLSGASGVELPQEFRGKTGIIAAEKDFGPVLALEPVRNTGGTR